MLISGKKVLTSEGWRENCTITVENGIITEITPGLTAAEVYDILSFGLFDIHVHGGKGYNTENDDPEALERFLLWEAQNGVTDVLLTVSTTSLELYAKCISFIQNAMDKQRDGMLPGAVIQGIHLEGPFLSKNRLGAMLGDRILEASVQNLLKIAGPELKGIRLVTLAPEVEGAENVARYLMNRGVCVQAGHTDATYEQAQEGFSWGINSLCHSFNACRPIHHRDPGIVTAALLNPDVYCETICDLNHLHPATIHLIRRCKGPERMCIISDSIYATGLDDGVYTTKLGKQVIVKDGCMRIPGGALDGGVCTIGEAMGKLNSIHFPVKDMLISATQTPAERIGIPAMGAVDIGKNAHIAAWTSNMKIKKTWIGDTQYE